GAGTPTGFVDFYDTGISYLGFAVLDSNGQATVSTTTLSLGTHSITAYYTADNPFTNSNGDLLQTVYQAGTSTALTSSVNPSLHGQSVTFTAVVAGQAGSLSPPTGSVA